MPAKRKNPEELLQKSVVEFLKVALPAGAVFHHSPNEGKNKVQYRKKQIAMGMRTGWPDLEIFTDEKIVFIELKAGKNKLTENQVDVHHALKSNGFPVYACWSLEEVKMALIDAGLELRCRAIT